MNVMRCETCWQSMMCTRLAELESHFYRDAVEGAWQFLEPTQFLRQNGALDESSTHLGPQVIIANYISGMSNCITSAPYYSICCLNDCDQVFQHIESVVSSASA